MNRKGEQDTSGPGILVPMIIAAVVIVLVFLFIINADFRNKISSIIPDFVQPDGVEDKEFIVRYSLSDGNVEYYTGVEWRALDTGGLNVNGKKLEADSLLEDFESYYYSTAESGAYSESFKQLGIREIPFTIAPPSEQKNEQNNPLLGRAVIEEFYRISPDNSVDEEGLVFGNIFRIGEDGNFKRNLFYLNDKKELFVSSSFSESNNEFIKTGYILNNVAVIDQGAVLRLLDTQTYLRASEINGLYLDKRDNYFYDVGEKTSFSVRNSDGKLFVYYGDIKLDMQVGFSDGDKERVIRSYSENFEDFEESKTKNELLIIDKIVEWRDSIFSVPIEITFQDESLETSCVEKIIRNDKSYLVTRIGLGNEESCDVA